MSETEDLNPKSKGIDRLSVLEILGLMNDEDSTVSASVRKSVLQIELAVIDAVGALAGGGRVFYAGAGTSGRMAVLDASEMPPTFGVPEGLFRAVLAGGEKALRSPVEGAEDDSEEGKRAASEVTSLDFVLGVSAGGKTPFVVSFLRESKAKGARTWLMTSNDIGGHPFADGVIKLITGPEIVAGSTRLKAATAQKMALNMFSTAVMIKSGRVYDGLMVDVLPANEKLIRRAEGIIMKVAGVGEYEAGRYLRLSGMNAKTAIVMKMKGASKEEAEGMLRERPLREIIEER